MTVMQFPFQISLLMLSCVTGCTRSLTFTVVDAQSGAPVPGVSVEHHGKVQYIMDIFGRREKTQSLSILPSGPDGVVKISGLDRELAHEFKLGKASYQETKLLFGPRADELNLWYFLPGYHAGAKVPFDGIAKVPLFPIQK
jgi:hypothetical protein